MQTVVSLDEPRQLERTHPSDTCARWADERNIPRATACPDHWEPDHVREGREKRLADWRDLPAVPDEPVPGSRAWAMEETGLRPGQADQ